MSQARDDLSKSRRILKQIDLLLDLVRDGDVFSKIPYKEIEILENSLLKSRMATANIMATLGDARGLPTTPLQRRDKGNEHGNTVIEKHDDGVSKGKGNRG